MAIAKPRPKPASAQNADQISEFIAGAPDSRPDVDPKVKTVKRQGNRSIITVSVQPELLTEFDAWANRSGLTRSAALALSMRKAINEG